MRDVTEVQIERAIVHVVDHRKPGPVFSEVELDLGGNDALHNYFERQVVNALRDSGIHPARFRDDGDQDAKDECFRILKSPRNFVSASQKLAQMLFDAMNGDQRIKPGSLAVCTYRASSYEGKRFLALIKLDPGEALRQKITTNADGKRVVSFDVESNVMPSAREKLQKAALVPPEGMQESYDLLLLDVQVPGIAAFFTKTFLNTVKAFNAETATEGLYIGIQNARNVLANEPPEGVDPIDVNTSFAIDHLLDAELQQPQTVISDFIARLPVTEEQREVIRDEVEKQLAGETEIEIAPAFAQEKLLKKKRLRGDLGVRFEVLAEHYDEVVKSYEEIHLANGTLVARMTIELAHPKWVK